MGWTLLLMGRNSLEGSYMFIAATNNSTLHIAAFRSHAGFGRRIIEVKPKQAFLTQGDQADSIFYLCTGRVRLTFVSQNGKETTITLLSAGDFVGKESLAAVLGLRLATATAEISCTALEIPKYQAFPEIATFVQSTKRRTGRSVQQ
jgi:CRP-like cAMP-binding protein